MSYTDDDANFPSLWVSLALAGAMLASFAYLAFGDGFDNEYAGFGALVALPFCLGALITHTTRFFSILGCLGTPLLLGGLSWALVLLGVEGFICVVMVMPFWIVAGLGGGVVSLIAMRHKNPEEDAEQGKNSKLKSVGLAVIPFLLIYAEGANPAQWEYRTVTRHVDISASAEKVWPLLASIPQISEQEGIETFTHDWLEVPRPSDAILVESENGLVREARWGTAIRFHEVITEMAPGRSMEWRFSFPDASLQNHTDRHISPDGEMLKIETGRYEIVPLASGKTRISLSTTYRMRTRLDWYFTWWGEKLLGDVQSNVLAIISQRSEAI